jgi:hypothetical protein
MYYIDNNKFHNIEKLIYANKKPIEIESFSQVLNLIDFDNGLNAELVFESDEPFMKLKGFDDLLLTKKNKKILKRKALHPTQSLALFSMGYATTYILEKHLNDSLTEMDIEMLSQIYNFVSSEVFNPLSTNSMAINDHAISERIQFISIFSSYLNKYKPSKRKLLSDLSKDFNICLGFLNANNHFTWSSNHGIMQLRSIAQIASIIKNDAIQQYLIKLFDERLKEVTPYFIGKDGAIYESASGYWLFIYRQFMKITNIELVCNHNSVIELKHLLTNSSTFINTVAANDGFLQGLGNSYSGQIKDLPANDSLIINRVFQFSNKLTGISWSEDTIHYNLLFVSLNTPPNVHKLPEDLAVYFYANDPFFSNTGLYEYGNSAFRNSFEKENSQSTVVIAPFDNKIPQGSEISSTKVKDGTVVMQGFKYYHNSDTIFRKVLYKDHQVEIFDSNSKNMLIRSMFNLHPNIEILEVNKNFILLRNNAGVTLRVESNNELTLEKGFISEAYKSTTKINRIIIDGNSNKITLRIHETNEPPKSFQPLNLNSDFTIYSETRQETANKLAYKYNSNKNNPTTFKKTLLLGVFFEGILIITILIEIYIKNRRSKPSLQ